MTRSVRLGLLLWGAIGAGALGIACGSSSPRDKNFGTDAGSDFEAPVREVGTGNGGAGGEAGGGGAGGDGTAGGGAAGTSGSGGDSGGGAAAGSSGAAGGGASGNGGVAGAGA